MKNNIWKKRFWKLKGFLIKVYSYLALRHTKLNLLVLQKVILKLKINKLHIGCGNILIKDWLNITFEPREEYGRVVEKDSAYLLNYNLLKKWPVLDNKIDFIAASHFIEHFDLNQGIKFAKECFRVMRKDAVIRLSCPDLEIYASRYVSKDKDFYENKLIKEWCTFSIAKTPGEIFAAKAYDSSGAHKWFYDFDSLKHILELSGFKQIKKCIRLEGRTPNLDIIEHPQRELETVYVEGVKG